MLYPIVTETRSIIDLNGIWNFKLDPGIGFQESWNNAKLSDTRSMAVPSSFNDILQKGKNRLTVAVNNIVDETTLPVGFVTEKEIPGIGKVIRNQPNFDFFNYAGLHRPVKIYTTPATYVKDVTIVTEIDGLVH